MSLLLFIPVSFFAAGGISLALASMVARGYPTSEGQQAMAFFYVGMGAFPISLIVLWIVYGLFARRG